MKVDLKKAYDRVEWAFIHECLQGKGMDLHTISLIMNCISQASFSILVNGKKSAPFNYSRGLRQGDPMSTYMFNLCLESLMSRINSACLEKDRTPFELAGRKCRSPTFYLPMTYSWWAGQIRKLCCLSLGLCRSSLRCQARKQRRKRIGSFYPQIGLRRSRKRSKGSWE